MTDLVNAPDVSIDSPYVKFVQTFFRWAGALKQTDVFEALKIVGVPEDMLPTVPADSTCLRRAFEQVTEGRRSLIRPLKKGGGWSLVLEDEEMLDLGQVAAHTQAHTVELTGRAVEENYVVSLVLTPDTHPMVPLIRAEFERQRELFMCSTDLSHWMTQRIIPWAHGVSARDRGGFYYIPKGEGTDRLMMVVNALHSISTREGPRNRMTQGGKIYIIPSVQQNDLVEAVMDAILEEADRECVEMESKISSGGLGLRALETQASRAKSLEAKLARYAAILGESLDDVKARVSEVQAGIGMAELIIEAENDKAS